MYENAIIVGVNLGQIELRVLNEEIDELILLADTAEAKVVDTMIQNKNKIDPSTFVGSGKMKSIINNAEALNCRIVIFNNELTPAQLKNIQKIAGDKIMIIDRTGLILNIFEKHAKTKEAKAQIQLAKLKYLLPRLTRQWTHLERQMGGVGTRGGPGEAQIEIDRRLIRKQITSLNKELKKIQSQRITQHKSRDNIYKVSLAGYTNAGKSSIMKCLSGSKAYIQDQLFSTLDTTTRKIENKNQYKFLLSDTVGFIRKLPHDLVASFRSTLMEIEESDLIIKVLDSSSLNIQMHLGTIEEVFKSLDISSKLELIVFNKIDLLDSHRIDKLKKLYPDAIFISAYRQLKINELIDAIQKKLSTLNIISNINIPYSQFSVIDYIYKNCKILHKKEYDDKVVLKIEASQSVLDKLDSQIK